MKFLFVPPIYHIRLREVWWFCWFVGWQFGRKFPFRDCQIRKVLAGPDMRPGLTCTSGDPYCVKYLGTWVLLVLDRWALEFWGAKYNLGTFQSTI